MAWLYAKDLAATSHTDFDYVRDVPAVNAAPKRKSGDLLARGTLVAELNLEIDCAIPTRLVHYENNNGWKRRFTVFLNADHSLSVETQQGSARSYVRLENWLPDPGQEVRMTYSWDAPTKFGVLTVESLNTGSIRQTIFESPVPMPLNDVKDIVIGCDDLTLDPRVKCLSASDRPEPVGPAPTITQGTLVETPLGQRPIEKLQLGDLVLTADRGPQPIRWIVRQKLPTVGTNSQIALHAPYFGLTEDIVVSQNQRLEISSVDAEYMFGEEAVLIEARQLLDHPGANLVDVVAPWNLYQILLDNHDCICLSGAWSESLFVGNLASSPELIATTRLAPLSAGSLPVHRRFARSVLQSFETKVLVEAMRA